MTRRVVIGTRNNGDIGVFVSPPGVDAYTAADSALIMSITSKVSTLILLGHAIAGPAVVPLGLGSRPMVFLTSEFNFSAVIGHTAGPGPLRPSPTGGGTGSTATINSSGVSMSINGIYPLKYMVYSAIF